MKDFIIISMEKGGFICEYAHNPYISRAIDVVEEDTVHTEMINGFEQIKSIEEKISITFELKNGKTVRHDVPKGFSSVYMRQYGIDVSEDGKYYFLHDWYARGGLSCFEVDTGKLHWSVKIKHTREAFVCGAYILCFFENNGIMKIRIDSGEIVGRYTFGNGDKFCRISKECFIIGQKKGYYIIINAELQELYRIPFKAMGEGVRTIYVLQGDLDGNLLTIYGSEETKDYHFAHPFRRTLDISKYAICPGDCQD